MNRPPDGPRPASTHAQVLVVGGGPVGMLLAAELGHHGVSTIVLEAEPRTVDQPKAGTLHARTVQGLARRGHLHAPAATEDRLGRSAADAFHFAGMPGLVITAPPPSPDPSSDAPRPTWKGTSSSGPANGASPCCADTASPTSARGPTRSRSPPRDRTESGTSPPGTPSARTAPAAPSAS